MTPTMRVRSTARAEDTRRSIYEAALELFQQKGFEQTTMRDVARKADVALGGAYYYFPSKEAIVLEFYREMQENSHDDILQAMQGQRKLKERLRCVLEKRLELLAPNRKFCDALFRHAPDSKDPLSPFSEETLTIRERAIEQMSVALEGADVSIRGELEPHLPRLLWLYQMGIILFWIYDRSPNQSRTQRLMDLSLGMVVNLIRLSGLPLMRPLRKTLLELLETVAL
jgi:AcrR family transcriptional regulator